jgi:acyl-CoA dehydrogenase
MSATLLTELHARARSLALAAEPELERLIADDAEGGELGAARRALALLAGAGLTAWTVPERHGGAAAQGLCAPTRVSVRALAALRSGLAYGHGLIDNMFVMQGLGSHALALAESAHAARLLPRVARGELVAAFGLTEPGAGSNLAEVATTAERAGSGWRLHGRKTFVSNAPLADVVTLLARTSGAPGDAGGLSMFLVERGARGFSSASFEVIAPHAIGELQLDGVELDGDALLGAAGGGLELALSVLARFRTSVAAAANGFARRALDESVAHLKARRQFGKPLAAQQALRFDVAEMDARLRAAELLVDEAARLSDEGAGTGAVAGPAVARAKLFATENASQACDRAVQLHGGLGVKRGHPVERLYREARALRIYEGTSEIQKLILARALLD